MLDSNLGIAERPASGSAWLSVFFGLVLLTAAGATLFGVGGMDALPSRPWHPTELVAIALACALPAGIMIVSAFTSFWRPAVVIAIVATAFLTYGPAVLAVVLFYALGSIAIGNVLYRIKLDSSESALLAFVLGFGTLGVAIGYTAPLRFHFDFVYGAILLGAILIARKSLMTLGALTVPTFLAQSRISTPSGVLTRLSISLAVFVALLLMLYASARESGFDALTTHFYMIDHLKTNGRFLFDIEISPFVLMPKTTIWGLSVAHTLGGEFALRALHASLFLVTAGLIAGRTAPQMGAGASALMIAGFLSAPVVYWVSSQLFEESGTTLFITAAAVFFLRGDTSDKPLQMDALALACLGMAVSSKPQALFFGTLGAVIVLRRLIVSGFSPASFPGIAGGGALFLVLACGPYLRAFLQAGNPFHPFTPGATVDARWEHALTVRTPYDMVFNTSLHMEAWPGGFTFQFLLLLAAGGLALLLGRWRSVSSLALVALVFCAVLALQTVYARYQLYAFPLLMISLAALYPQLAQWARIGLGAFLFAIVPLNLSFWQSVHVPTFQLRQLLDPAQSPDVPGERVAFDLLNSLHGANTSVYVASSSRYAGGLEGTPHSRSKIAQLIHSAQDFNSLAAALRQGRITHVVLTGAPINPLILEFCEVACSSFPDLPKDVKVFAVDANRVGLFADRIDAFELLGLPDPTEETVSTEFLVLAGWSKEVWGWWSTSDSSTIKLGTRFTGAEKLVLEVKPFRPAESPPLIVSLHLDGVHLGDWTFQNVPIGQSEIREALLPNPLAEDAPKILTFSFNSTMTPDEALGNGDNRSLAIGLVSVSR